MINILDPFNKEKLEDLIKKCDLFYNSSGEESVLEHLKMIEEFGKKVIDSSKVYYYTEDKWMFYLKCKKHNIPTPETILLSNNLNMIRSELKEFGRWPVVLKRIYGTNGQYVEKANNINEAIKIIKLFWQKDCDKISVIAQEFIKSPSYRVTIINKKPMQSAIKKSNNWKCTGVYSKKCDAFKIDKNLKRIIKKVADATRINVCGIDLLKKDGNWLVIEVNAEPGLDFIDNQEKMLISKILDFLKSYSFK